MENFENLVYSYKHRKIIMYLARKYFDNDELMEQLKKHDLDKMYLLLFYPKKAINQFHRSMCTHHDNDIPKTELDYMEMILDWESARYSKGDKPLNAFDTLYKFYPHLEEHILPILKSIGLAYSTLEKEKDVEEYAASLGEPTIEDIKKDLVDYIKNLDSKKQVKKKTIKS